MRAFHNLQPDSIEFVHSRRLKDFRGETLAVINMGKLKFTGMAICSPKDEFNLTRGEEIALARAKKAAWQTLRKRHESNQFDVHLRGQRSRQN